MKRFFFILFFSFFNVSNAQVTEFRISLDSGLYSYGGEGASSSTNMIIYAGKHYGYTQNPYGNNNGFCYGLSADLKHIDTSKTIFGLSTGYEILRSKTTIILVEGDPSSFSGGVDAFGAQGAETVTTNYNLNAFPYAGRRFMSNKTPIDIVLGMDIAYILGSQEKGDVTTLLSYSTGAVTINPGSVGNIDTIPVLGPGYKATYTSSNNIYTSSLDFRPRIQVSSYFYNFGLYLGYSYGLVNYNTKPKEGANTGNAYSRMIRFGITYKLF